MNWLRLIKNIPVRFSEERSDQLAHGHADGYRRLYLSPSEWLICPDSALVVSIWRFHFFSRGGRRELKDFLDLACGCQRLFDLGASAGIFSALFANTRSGGSVLSIEPDGKSFRLLAETAKLNQKSDMDWHLLQAVVTDKPGKVAFRSVEFGGNIVAADEGNPIESHSLESLFATSGYIPDIIKLDVESYEYDVLLGAVDWLKTHRPRLFLELHWKQLEDRGLNPEDLLKVLSDIGYRWGSLKDFVSLARYSLDNSGVVRIPLIASPSLPQS
ncbi:MAG: FkbM family methyltransferase [Prosthecobacter sp.]|nr:FkbM family methyltransferase [Prosthecobacter sp.]